MSYREKYEREREREREEREREGREIIGKLKRGIYRCR